MCLCKHSLWENTVEVAARNLRAVTARQQCGDSTAASALGPTNPAIGGARYRTPPCDQTQRETLPQVQRNRQCICLWLYDVPNYGHPHVLAWLASKISTTKSAMSGSIRLACLAWNDGGAFMISVRLPISVSIVHMIAPNVMIAAINNTVLVMVVI